MTWLAHNIAVAFVMQNRKRESLPPTELERCGCAPDCETERD